MKAAALLLLPAAGLAGWAAAFTVIYGLHGLGCASGWGGVPIGASSLQRLVLVGAWLACLVPLGLWAWWLRTRRPPAGAGQGATLGLLWTLGEASAWSGAAATLVSLAPVALTSVCL